ncbi:unnamed protein product [Cylicocyclus nassatus]|uniref:N-acetyltransferase domain-containing protein n=1 Tax=Cylicocyclus nassatus TaxID=53992 RepID=A0AA36HDE0_CYLNA|nr:unnamed protein product [Cylicocyclus nassatus]
MEKSLSRVKYVLNPPIEHWAIMAELIAKTVDWSLTIISDLSLNTNEIIGSISTAYDRSTSGQDEDDCCCIRTYYVREDWRHIGLGTALFKKVLEIGKNSNKALHGVMKMTKIYAEYYILKDLKDVDMEKLTSYDASISHRKREKYVKNFISTDNCYVKVAFDRSNNIVGYCSVRTSLANTLCTAPLYADNEVVARSLLSGVLSMIKDTSYKYFSSEFPDINEDAHRLFESLGNGHTTFEPYTQCAFTKKILPFEEAKVFGILECGNSFV